MHGCNRITIEPPSLGFEEGRHCLVQERRAAGVGEEKGGGHRRSTLRGRQRRPGQNSGDHDEDKGSGESVLMSYMAARGARGGGKRLERNVVDLLVELFEYCQSSIPWGGDRPIHGLHERGEEGGRCEREGSRRSA